MIFHLFFNNNKNIRFNYCWPAEKSNGKDILVIKGYKKETFFMQEMHLIGLILATYLHFQNKRNYGNNIRNLPFQKKTYHRTYRPNKGKGVNGGHFI